MNINITKKTSTTNTTASQGRKILYIVEHYTAGVTSKSGSAADTAAWFSQEQAKASADFIVDDANIIQYNPDPANRYCWAVGGNNYGNKGGSLYGVAKNANSISVEICSTNSAGKITTPNDSKYSFTDAVVAKAVELTKYLMETYGIDADHVIRHYDVNGKPCPGIVGWNAESGDESKWKAFKEKLNTSTTTSGLQASSLKGLTEAQVVKKVGNLFTQNQKDTGILASVSLAQFILESGYASTELAQNANNCFGMKKSLSGNTWSGSTWDGVSVYTKQTKEQKTDGTEYTVTADFRKYSCIEDSIADHSAYLLGAMNGSVKRYSGLKGCTDYEKAIQIIKNGGYATDVSYVSKICNIIEKWNLTEYDIAETTNSSFPATPFSVKVLIDDLNYRSEPSMNGTVKGQTGKGTFTITELSGSWGKLKSGAGWIWLGNASYCTIQAAVFTPYSVKVKISDLNIRKGAGTDTSIVQVCPPGVYTIVEEANGKGATKWGKLKSGIGWISLDYAVKV